jgi:hypothetical protein
MLLVFSALMIVSAGAPEREATAVKPAMRVWFGHQSVGGNVLEGVRAVAPDVHVGSSGAGASDGVVVIDTLVGQNEQPFSKIEAFEAQVNAQARNLDAAMFKFCYVDFDGRTDVGKIFAAYEAAYERVKQANPHLVLAHVTTPMTVVQSGPKAWLKGILGRAPWGFLENQKRAEFNRLLRQRYAGKEPLFDLAELEARAPTGQPSTYEAEGHAWPMLYPGYTSDGGHLNDTGKRKLGEAFAAFLRGLRQP